MENFITGVCKLNKKKRLSHNLSLRGRRGNLCQPSTRGNKALGIVKKINKSKWLYFKQSISTLVIASLIAPMILMIPASPFANQKA